MNEKKIENEQNNAASGDKPEPNISKNLAENDLATAYTSSGDKSQSNISSNSTINKPALDLSTTASSLRSSRVMQMQSPDLALGCDVTSESERSFKDNVMRHHMQIEMNNNCGSISKTQNEARWLSFPGMIVSDPHLLPHAGEDSNKVCGWPIVSGFPNSQLYNYSTFNPNEKAKQSETVPSYKLFGVKLINHSSSSTPMASTTTQLSTVTTSHSWLHHMQTGINNSCTGSVSKPQIEGSSLSSPDMGVSQHLFPNAREYAKGSSRWPIIPGFSNPEVNNIGSTFNPISEIATGYRLFGISLGNHSSSSSTPLDRTPTQLHTMSSGTTQGNGPTTIDSDQKSDISKVSNKEKKRKRLQGSAKEIQRRQSCNSIRSCTKVLMQGDAVGRAVDLAMLEGYDQFIDKLEEMFDIMGELCLRNKWEIVYTISEEDMKLLDWNFAWLKFRTMVRRIFIWSSKDVKKISTGRESDYEIFLDTDK
ncbi:AUX/IAA protein [Corchorus olitorius]|uniref:Auxin-responsive protein n=1 Tax=Corchorus olitorius TaxID=93759 RepID=A0A1R3HI57_9ROSI|nr:AUX/IAA protein [Corchorus olitorius]